MKLYGELAELWSLLTPTDTYDQEALVYCEWLRHAAGKLETVLELGCGIGQLARQFPDDIQMTLVDLAPEMLAISQRTNPHQEHVLADMRTLDLQRQFDAVLIHDAIMYITTESDLLLTLQRAATHLRPGGALLLLPDVIKETFQEATISGGAQDDQRAIQLLEWRWDPNPDDQHFQVEFSILLREHGEVRSIHESHTMGLFDLHTWVTLLHKAGFHLITPPEMEFTDENAIFLATKN